MLRHAHLLAVAALLGGCFFNGNGQLQGEADNNGNGNGSGNGSNNGTGNTLGGGNTGTTETGVTPDDGAWDITAAAGDSIGPSEFVLAGDLATGFISKKGEGAPDPGQPWCTVTRDRNEFRLQASASTLDGSFTVVTEWSGFNCPENQRRTVTVTGKRTVPGKNALDGTWTLTVSDPSPVNATLKVSTSAGTVSATSTSSQLSFAARRR